MENIFQDEISTWLPLYSYEERKFVKFPATRPTVDIREILTKRTSMAMPPFSCLINRSEPQYYSYGVFDMNGNIYFDEISIWFLMHPSKKRTDGKFLGSLWYDGKHFSRWIQYVVPMCLSEERKVVKFAGKGKGICEVGSYVLSHRRPLLFATIVD
ncbi:hypothetical protein MTR67_037724 [Solanum verrucosum]|uniref:Uncharacterized protein n=1 Tax=Solanum verrucosum TaxID=315347 RepID=A0AAF0UFC1_SOLVR|nr:hypothetical protein MTR67_037724 [Solanum verrucosum]